PTCAVPCRRFPIAQAPLRGLAPCRGLADQFPLWFVFSGRTGPPLPGVPGLPIARVLLGPFPFRVATSPHRRAPGPRALAPPRLARARLRALLLRNRSCSARSTTLADRMVGCRS